MTKFVDANGRPLEVEINAENHADTWCFVVPSEPTSDWIIDIIMYGERIPDEYIEAVLEGRALAFEVDD